MDEAAQDQLFPDSIGDRLKAAREAKGLSLVEVAQTTRIPTRHLQHIEDSEWEALPAVTYSIGFTRAYANAVGLDGNVLGAELREQLGAHAPYATGPAPYEPADPARVPPRTLAIVAALIAVAIILGYAILRSGAIDGTAVDTREAAGIEVPVEPAQPAAAPPAARPAPAAAAAGPVVLTAIDSVWLRVYEGGGGPRLLERELKAGESYEVPATARAPQILTGRPDALRVTVGGREIAPLGAPQKTIADVSLLPADLAARAAAPPPAR